MAAVKCLCYTIFFEKWIGFQENSFKIGICLVRQLKQCIKKYIKRLYTKLFFTWEYILPRHLLVHKKPLICFLKQVILMKWRNKLLSYSISFTGHRKSAYCLPIWVFLEIWFIAPLWHWRSQDFPKCCCHHDLKAKLGIIVYFWIL